MQKMNAKDQVILEIFYVKESSNVTSRENFGVKTQKPGCLTVYND